MIYGWKVRFTLILNYDKCGYVVTTYQILLKVKSSNLLWKCSQNKPKK